MRGIPTPSTDCSSAEPSPTFPYRPRPKTRKRSPNLQKKNHAHELADSIAWRRSIRLVARVIVVAAPFMCLIAAATLVDSRACARTASRPASTDRFAKFVEEASDRFAVPARWIRAVIRIESGGDEHSISPRGAMGLMQLMPGTWVELRVLYGLGLDPFDPRDNVFAGTAYLREMHDRFGSAGFLAAYHAGPSRYEQHLATGQPLPPDTVAYVAAVAPLLGNEHGERAAFGGRRAVPWRQSPLFTGRVDARD
jgi:soluble lytic murein transglycosylase-like protein